MYTKEKKKMFHSGKQVRHTKQIKQIKRIKRIKRQLPQNMPENQLFCRSCLL